MEDGSLTWGTQACSVTCACAYAPEAGVKETFYGGDIPKLLDLMDRAHTLCAFNGARFDIPFLQTRYEIGCSLVGAVLMLVGAGTV